MVEEDHIIKRKLSIEEQIQDMHKKGVKFEICSESEAKLFLKYNNYYFKLKSYAKNYNVSNITKKYFNLDFAYLIELSRLDSYLRKTIMELSLDVEHWLKVRLIDDMTKNDLEDGYNIVNLYFLGHSTVKDDIKRKAKNYSFCSDLALKHINEDEELEGLALWNIVELLTFGNFMELYEAYYQTYDSYNYHIYLKSIKFIRNAAAHNNCILSSIKQPNAKAKFNSTKELISIMQRTPGIKEIDNINGMMKNPVIHDFVALLFVYNDILKLPETREIRNLKMSTIREDFCGENGRFQLHKDYFSTNPYLKEAYMIVSKIIIFFDKKE